MSDTLTIALRVAVLVGMGGLIAYQVYMLVWVRRTAGSIPRAVLVLRIINITALVAGTGAILWVLLP